MGEEPVGLAFPLPENKIVKKYTRVRGIPYTRSNEWHIQERVAYKMCTRHAVWNCKGVIEGSQLKPRYFLRLYKKHLARVGRKVYEDGVYSVDSEDTFTVLHEFLGHIGVWAW